MESAVRKKFNVSLQHISSRWSLCFALV